MSASEMFESAVRAQSDLAGVFEYDGETGYFYLYDIKGDEGQNVIAAIHIVTGSPDFQEKDISILWDSSEKTVGLFIRGRLWAVFDVITKATYGGNYRANAQSSIPEKIAHAFERS